MVLVSSGVVVVSIEQCSSSPATQGTYPDGFSLLLVKKGHTDWPTTSGIQLPLFPLPV